MSLDYLDHSKITLIKLASAAIPGKSHLREELKKPINDKIYFAGEACHHLWPATVTGAYLSGLETANQIYCQLVNKT